MVWKARLLHYHIKDKKSILFFQLTLQNQNYSTNKPYSPYVTFPFYNVQLHFHFRLTK